MARHTAVDLSQVFGTPPRRPEQDRLPAEELERLRDELEQVHVCLLRGEAADRKNAKLRSMYEPYVHALSEYLMLPLPSWLPEEGAQDDWRSTAWEV
jgi:hypothetical protein